VEDLSKNNSKLGNAKKESASLNKYQMGIPCQSCGSTMHYIYGEMFECPNCGRKESTDFGKVREYLDLHGPTPAAIISDQTGVKLHVIETFLRQGRVEIPDGTGVYIKCEKCGEDIRYGRYCPDCIRKLSSELNKAMWSPDVGEKPTVKADMSGRMHLQRRNRKNNDKK